MSSIRPPVSRSQAEASVTEYTALAKKLYEERLFSHPFMLGLQNGTTPDHQLRGWLQNWYTFALEVNTASSTIYHRFVSFFKMHPQLEELMTTTIAEEFSQPGPGGHIRTVERAGAAAGLTPDEMISARLVPEARAWVDFHVRLLTEGTLAEAAADYICEGEFGHFAKIYHDALTTRYGFTRKSAGYFKDHFESDAVSKADRPSHGDRGRAILTTLFEEGLVEERAGWGIEYTIDITVSMFELLLDGIVRRYPA
jgi:pyrroloquinoline quinone (PQQ) biosynthesis protein C